MWWKGVVLSGGGNSLPFMLNPTALGWQVNPEDDDPNPRRRGKKLTEYEMWESKQLISSGRVAPKQM